MVSQFSDAKLEKTFQSAAFNEVHKWKDCAKKVRISAKSPGDKNPV